MSNRFGLLLFLLISVWIIASCKKKEDNNAVQPIAAASCDSPLFTRVVQYLEGESPVGNPVRYKDSFIITYSGRLISGLKQFHIDMGTKNAPRNYTLETAFNRIGDIIYKTEVAATGDYRLRGIQDTLYSNSDMKLLEERYRLPQTSPGTGEYILTKYTYNTQGQLLREDIQEHEPDGIPKQPRWVSYSFLNGDLDGVTDGQNGKTEHPFTYTTISRPAEFLDLDEVMRGGPHTIRNVHMPATGDAFGGAPPATNYSYALDTAGRISTISSHSATSVGSYNYWWDRKTIFYYECQ